MKGVLLYLVFVLIIVFSCRKDDLEEYEPVYAGSFNTTMQYFEFSPPVHPVLKNGQITGYSYGTDSLDIDSNGQTDILISLGILTGTINDPVPGSYPHLSLTVRNGFEVATRKESFPVGHGQYGSINWVDTLQFNTRIDTIHEWSETNTRLWMWVVPPTSFWGSYGCWYHLINSEMFIGIRKKEGSDYDFGWIQVKLNDRKDIYFRSAALED